VEVLINAKKRETLAILSTVGERGGNNLRGMKDVRTEKQLTPRPASVIDWLMNSKFTRKQIQNAVSLSGSCTRLDCHQPSPSDQSIGIQKQE